MPLSRLGPFVKVEVFLLAFAVESFPTRWKRVSIIRIGHLIKGQRLPTVVWGSSTMLLSKRKKTGRTTIKTRLHTGEKS